MNVDAVREYIDRYLNRGDSESFHNVIEFGDEAVEVVEQRLRSMTSLEEFSALYDLLKEISSKRAAASIRRGFESTDLKRWSVVLEAYLYNEPANWRTELDQIRASLKARNDADPRIQLLDEALC